jgi:hypothetical protein
MDIRAGGYIIGEKGWELEGSQPPPEEPEEEVEEEQAEEEVVAEAPAKSAPKADWYEYRLSQGYAKEDIETLTKDELMELEDE